MIAFPWKSRKASSKCGVALGRFGWSRGIRGLDPFADSVPDARTPAVPAGASLRRASSEDGPARVANGPGSVELTEARTALGEGRPEDALRHADSTVQKAWGQAAENAAYEVGRVFA